jgi:hypothetical protein
MLEALIDFASGQRSSDEQLAGAIPQSVNVLVDGKGAIHLRPGISEWSDFDEPPSHDDETSVDGPTYTRSPVSWLCGRLVLRYRDDTT